MRNPGTLLAEVQARLIADAITLDLVLGEGWFERHYDRLEKVIEDANWRLLRAAVLVAAEDGAWEAINALDAYEAARA